MSSCDNDKKGSIIPRNSFQRGQKVLTIDLICPPLSCILCKERAIIYGRHLKANFLGHGNHRHRNMATATNNHFLIFFHSLTKDILFSNFHQPWLCNFLNFIYVFNKQLAFWTLIENFFLSIKNFLSPIFS